jgi:hypothetical protein
MRLVIQGKELEFRIQERRVTTCSVFHKGVEIAADLAIHAPQDPYDQKEGERVAVTRVADILVERCQLERKESIQKVDKVFTEVGALSGNVELPQIPGANEIVGKVMEKLDARRDRKAKEDSAKAIESAKATVKAFQEKFPSAKAGLAGLDFISSPFLRPGTIFCAPSAPRFAFPFGISTKPRGW